MLFDVPKFWRMADLTSSDRVFTEVWNVLEAGGLNHVLDLWFIKETDEEVASS